MAPCLRRGRGRGGESATVEPLIRFCKFYPVFGLLDQSIEIKILFRIQEKGQSKHIVWALRKLGMGGLLNQSCSFCRLSSVVHNYSASSLGSVVVTCWHPAFVQIQLNCIQWS